MFVSLTLFVFFNALTLGLTTSVDVQPSPIATVTEGSVLWLTCTYDLAGGTLGQLQWLGNIGGIVATVTPSAGTVCTVSVSGYNIDCDNLASSEVRLGILNPVHGDNYSCRAFLTDSTQIGPVSTEVSVVVPVTSVTFTSPVSQTVTVTPGGSQMYTCVTGSCRPSARIDWYKDGVNVTTQTGSVSSIGDMFVTTSSLTLTGSKGDTPATVQCRASSVNGIAAVQSGIKEFIVQWAPDGPPVISGYTQTTVLYPNDMETLQCRQPGGNPLATLTWSGKCGTITATNSNTATEAVSDIIITVSKDYNQETCTCVSTHPQPQSQDRTQVTFTVHYTPSSPVIIQTPSHPWLAGQNGTLSCSYTEGFPTLTRIEWFRDGLQTGQSIPSITLGPLSHTDNRAGYSCRVHNAFTDAKHTDLTSAVTHLNVEYKPLVTLVPTQLTVVEGNTTQVTCEAVGNPTPIIQWLRRGSPVHTGGVTSLTLEDVDRSATDNYICRAEGVSTVQGRQLVTERSVSVLVQYPPMVSVISSLTGVVAEGDKGVSLMCQTTGEPNTLITQSWTQTIGQTFITNQFIAQDTIVLSEVSLDDTGTYTCSVSNGIADRQGHTLQSNSTVLDVIVAPKFNTSGQNHNFYSKLHEPVTIKILFYSNPPVKSTDNFEWMKLSTGALVMASINTTFKLLNGEAIDLSVKGRTVTFTGQAAIMKLSSFDQSLAGTYTVTVYNDDNNGRQSTTNFSVTASGPPETPTNFRVIDATTTSITVEWTKGFNGGHTQTFVILYGPEGGTLTQTLLIAEKQRSTYIQEVTDLKPNTRYQLHMYAFNEEGNSTFSSAANIISKTQEDKPGTAMSAIAGGVGGSVVVLLIIIAVAVVLYRRRNAADGKGLSQRSDAALFNPDHNEEEDGMKRNILYESAGPYRPECQQDGNTDGKNEYAVVDKKNKNLAGTEYAEVVPKKDRKGKKEKPAENGDLYAQVQRNGKEKGNGKEKKRAEKGEKKSKKSNSGGQTATVYENVGAVGGKPEELYANADDKTKPVEAVPEEQTPSRKKNQEGLVYLDVEFKESQNGTRQAVIHGIENRNDYALVDFTRSAEPLPADNGAHNPQ